MCGYYYTVDKIVTHTVIHIYLPLLNCTIYIASQNKQTNKQTTVSKELPHQSRRKHSNVLSSVHNLQIMERRLIERRLERMILRLILINCLEFDHLVGNCMNGQKSNVIDFHVEHSVEL